MGMDWLPPVPLVTVASVVYVPVPVSEPRTVNALPYAASQLMVTLQRFWLVPRSTCHVWLSAKLLAKRVPALPSTAIAAVLPPSTLDAVAVLPCATLSLVQVPPVGGGVVVPPAVPKTWNSYSE